MPIEIFISYRRSDAGGHARYLGKELLQWFDEPHVFFDLASLELGDVFTQKIDAAVRECSVLLALIAAGTLVTEGMVVPPGSLVMGSPGRVKRPLTEADVASVLEYSRNYVRYRLDYMVRG